MKNLIEINTFEYTQEQLELIIDIIYPTNVELAEQITMALVTGDYLDFGK